MRKTVIYDKIKGMVWGLNINTREMYYDIVPNDVVFFTNQRKYVKIGGYYFFYMWLRHVHNMPKMTKEEEKRTDRELLTDLVKAMNSSYIDYFNIAPIINTMWRVIKNDVFEQGKSPSPERLTLFSDNGSNVNNNYRTDKRLGRKPLRG